MNVYGKFKKGLLTAASSFSLLWTHKKLLVYLGIPILVYVILEILVHNMHSSCACFFYQKSLVFGTVQLAGPSRLLNYIKIIFLSLAYLTIINAGNIALSYHTSMVFQKRKLGVREVVSATFAKIKTVFVWTFFLLIPTVTFYTINTYNLKMASSLLQLVYIMFILALLAIWSLIASFVIQAIAIDHLGVIASIKKSIHIVKNILPEFLGTLFWLGLIGILSATPFMLLEKYANKFYLITIPLALLIYCTITSAYTVAKTLLYLDFKKQ